jgi:L-ascorbate metabolism protein UlaG (beta-lactamase superfamily)
MRIQRLGHATVLIEMGITRVVIDPGSYSTEWHDLSDLSAVFVTHEHHDHFAADHIAEMMPRNPEAVVYGPRPVVQHLEQVGIETTEIRPGDNHKFADLELDTVGGTHAVVHETIPRVPNVGLVVTDRAGTRFFHPGDSFDVAPESVDFLGLPLFSPWSTAGPTADFLNAVSPKVAFPIHDAGLSEYGHATFMRIVGRLSRSGTDLTPVDRLASFET